MRDVADDNKYQTADRVSPMQCAFSSIDREERVFSDKVLFAGFQAHTSIEWVDEALYSTSPTPCMPALSIEI